MKYSQKFITDRNSSLNKQKIGLAPCCKWIINASVIHLASYWDVDSLIYFLEIDPMLIHRPTGLLTETFNAKLGQGYTY